MTFDHGVFITIEAMTKTLYKMFIQIPWPENRLFIIFCLPSSFAIHPRWGTKAFLSKGGSYQLICPFPWRETVSLIYKYGPWLPSKALMQASQRCKIAANNNRFQLGNLSKLSREPLEIKRFMLPPPKALSHFIRLETDSKRQCGF